ncbi:MerR family transcriptional regulator [Paenibacillus methanolicus]|uniref:MerR-like DNA binding protein n=1 Tax=Paenibacillus methanolicus TaxID=582686 RepID=A0A5S5C1E0_9BACL|nr:methyltransferase domain-containing protein [Paenibacillus methanolicus]TYP73114.1 MerR-like DNA binding protein [Paenibacillus methanolicus]
MELSEPTYFTTGQLAKRTGLTLRTLRYYDQIGLLTPGKDQIGAARRYDVDDLRRLQQIQTLKYVGLSLEEIGQLLAAEMDAGRGIRDSLLAQLDVLRQKMAHAENVVKAIRQALADDERLGERSWSHLADIIRAVQAEQKWGEQYRNASRLQSRIHLYDRFSTNRHGWHRWVFDQLGTERDVHVLEVGCGDGALWLRNADRIPESWRITLTDISQGMLEEARDRLQGLPQFKFLLVDAQDIPFHDGQFDKAIANNMLYHVRNIPQAINEIHRVLKKGGQCYATTMSLRHLQEVERLGTDFDPAMKVLDRVIERFHLDNAAEQFAPLFHEVQPLMYEDRLVITEAEPLIDYMTSTPMNARSRLQGAALERFRDYVGHRLENEGPLKVTKENGMYIGRK